MNLMSKILVAFCILCFITVYSSAADGMVQPQLPHAFYGNIMAGGKPVPAGVPVEAQGEGIKTGIPGNPIYSREGGYGSQDAMSIRLEVQGTVASGAILTFYVGGIEAEVFEPGSQDGWKAGYPFSPGAVTQLELRIPVEVTPAPDYRAASGQETAETVSTATTPASSAVSGGLNTSPEVMLLLIVVLVVLGGGAYYFGKRNRPDKEEKKE